MPEFELESIGKRIARLRNRDGWTQDELAARLAISRVAVSHIEMDLTTPGERTITLLAGIFHTSPHELVQGTTYPLAKAERLPSQAACYTPLEMDCLFIRHDIHWLEHLEETIVSRMQYSRLVQEVYSRWHNVLATWESQTLDPGDKKRLAQARQALNSLLNQVVRND